MTLFGKCDGCRLLQELVESLRADVRERDQTLLAIYSDKAYRQRFPQPKEPKVEVADAPLVVTGEMLRNTTYTPPHGRDPFEVQLDFEKENDPDLH